MPRFVTADFKGKELYFDMRPDEKGEPEGFWAVPIFDSDRNRIVQESTAEGKTEGVMHRLLSFSIKKWTGFKNMKGDDIDCTAENIKALCDSDFGTMMVILNKIHDAANAGQVITEKN